MQNSESEIDQTALLAGDPEEFKKVVVQESPRLFAVLRRYVQDDDEARSLMQETFLAAFEGLESYRGDSKFTTWLYAIGINQARSRFRRTKRHNLLTEEQIDRLQPSFSMGRYAEKRDAWQPDDVFSASERQRIVRKAISRLPDNYRIVVELRDIQEFSTKEAAKMLDTTSGALRVRLHRARQALRGLLEPYFSESS